MIFGLSETEDVHESHLGSSGNDCRDAPLSFSVRSDRRLPTEEIRTMILVRKRQERQIFHSLIVVNTKITMQLTLFG